MNSSSLSRSIEKVAQIDMGVNHGLLLISFRPARSSSVVNPHALEQRARIYIKNSRSN